MWTLFVIVLAMNITQGGGAFASVTTHQFQSQQACQAAAKALAAHEGVIGGGATGDVVPSSTRYKVETECVAELGRAVKRRAPTH